MDTASKEHDFELIQAILDGDENAFSELVKTHVDGLFRVAYGMLGNRQDAEEVVQDAFVRAYHALPTFRMESSFRTWMHRIVVNLAKNRFQWNYRHGDGQTVPISEINTNFDDGFPDDYDVPDASPQPDKALELEEMHQIIMGAMLRLSDSLRETMTLRHLEGMSYDAIAELLNCGIGTVKSRLARGREILREYFTSLNARQAAVVKYLSDSVEKPTPDS